MKKEDALKSYNTFQQYFIEEFADDYQEGLLSRRSFVRRLAFITGSMTAANTVMTALGLGTVEVSSPEVLPPDPTLFAAQTTSVEGAQSPYSVPSGDPAIQASEVTFPSQDSEISAYFARPTETGVFPGILVCHENRGLNVHIKDVTRRFAKDGYVALAIDLLSREGGTSALDRDQIPGLLGAAGADRHVIDFLAGFGFLQGLDEVDAERIGMTGYCFGGGITWRVATALPDLKAAVPFYGPAPDLAQVGNIKAAVLGVYAELDSRINAGNDALEQALKAAGTTYQFNVYPGVNHAFHNDTGRRYVEAQATQAWLDTLAWFETHL
ncbi:MAG: dienelactone hydrolase family protein [Trueperaceae bacterium]|nr:MAG: dienelactone hydrolase family protein [Trueperaceae bacterium]